MLVLWSPGGGTGLAWRARALHFRSRWLGFRSLRPAPCLFRQQAQRQSRRSPRMTQSRRCSPLLHTDQARAGRCSDI
eukprot:8667273-Lingulodinium_polyedra.AAC.1